VEKTHGTRRAGSRSFRMIDEDIVVDEHGPCVCVGCVGQFRRVRDREGVLELVCIHCAVAFEAPHLEAED
jgi:hypothetical protein